MKKYNKLTKKLISEGVNASNYNKSKYRIPTSFNENALDNIYGGFEYQSFYIYEQTFKTPCGLQCKGLELLSNLYFNGIEYCYENNNALAECPYNNFECKYIDKNLNNLNLRCKCPVKIVEEEYIYKKSIESILKLRDDEINRKKVSFIMSKNGKICENHMYYDKDKQEWEFNYNPSNCVNGYCKACISDYECPIICRKLDKNRGNVYYDQKIKYRRYDLDGTLFHGQVDTEICKNKRVFKSPISMDICNAYAKLCKDEIIKKVKNNYFTEIFFSKYHNKYFEVEVINIRAESKPSRDLIKDLQDIREGIKIYHESDNEKKQKEEKKQKREILNQKKIKSLEKKLITTGYWNLDSYSIDKIHADKWLGMERIYELEEIRKNKKEVDKNKPIQLSIFDLLEK